MTTPSPTDAAIADAIIPVLTREQTLTAPVIAERTGYQLAEVRSVLVNDSRFVVWDEQLQHASVRGGGSLEQDLWGLGPRPARAKQ